MSPIQLLLVVALIGVVYFSRFRSRLKDRLVVMVLACGGTVLILFPDSTLAVAHSLGVGRGVDMVFYFSFLATGFALLMLFAAIRQLELKLTAIIREIAILQAKKPGTHVGLKGTDKSQAASEMPESGH